jgi:hypothetical protein
MNRTKAVMICGAGHSGSTLLGLILGSHSKGFYIGEGGKIRFLGDPRKALRKRACKVCGESCEVWSSFSWDTGQPLYLQVAEHVGASVVVDSTKNVGWLGDRIRETALGPMEAHLVMLLRDGRAVMNSRFRKYPERDAEEQLRDWMEQIELTRTLFAEYTGPKSSLRYEELATRPDATIRELCASIGIEFEPAMLEFSRFEHHPLGGNNGTQYLATRDRATSGTDSPVTVGARSREYYQQHPTGISLDVRWHRELDREHRALFDRVAGSFNEPMAWEA